MAQPRLWDAPAEEIEAWLHQPADPTPEHEGDNR